MSPRDHAPPVPGYMARLLQSQWEADPNEPVEVVVEHVPGCPTLEGDKICTCAVEDLKISIRERSDVKRSQVGEAEPCPTGGER
jgi:hypothetical protein